MIFATSRRRSAATVGALISAALLSACSSKPETADIAKQLSGIAQQCGLITISDVKKLDGAAGQNGLYEVAYSLKAEIKGGKSAAADLLSKWLTLEDESAQLNRMPINDIAAGRAREQRLRENDQELRKLLGSCDNLEAISWLQGFKAMAAEASQGGKTEISVPFAMQLQGGGTMRKAESGWFFAQLRPHMPGEVFKSEPVKFERRAPSLAAPSPSASALSSERTLVGVLNAGTTDSCFSVGNGKEEKCYAIPAEGPSTAQIFGSCKAGAKCSITATFDDIKEELRAVKAVSMEY